MYQKITLFAAALLFSLCATAQEETTKTTETSAPVADTSTPASDMYANKFAVGISGSTLGFGFEVAKNMHPNLNLRFRVNTLGIKDYAVDLDLGDKPVSIIANGKFLNLDLSLEYLPFTKSSFKLVGGLAYFTKAEGDATILYNGTVEYGEIVLDKDDIGQIDFNINSSGMAPYLGLGFGRAVPKNRVGLSVEAGTYYLPSPKVDIIATKMLSPTSNEAESLQSDLADYRWYPFINLKLAVRLN